MGEYSHIPYFFHSILQKRSVPIGQKPKFKECQILDTPAIFRKFSIKHVLKKKYFG